MSSTSWLDNASTFVSNAFGDLGKVARSWQSYKYGNQGQATSQYGVNVLPVVPNYSNSTPTSVVAAPPPNVSTGLSFGGLHITPTEMVLAVVALVGVLFLARR